MVTSWKIRKVNRDIAKLERNIEKEEEKLLDVRELKESGKITKAKYQKAKMNSAAKIRGMNIAIGRKKVARQTFEKKIREKQEEEDEDAL